MSDTVTIGCQRFKMLVVTPNVTANIFVTAASKRINAHELARCDLCKK
jgi:hypothetical protein